MKKYLALITLTLLTIGCSDDNPVSSGNRPIVTGPQTVAFGTLQTGMCKDTTIRYDNTTGSKVTISSVTFTDAALTWSGTQLPVEIAAGSSIDLKLRYCPTEAGTAVNYAVIKGSGGDSVRIAIMASVEAGGPAVGSRFFYSFELRDSNNAIVDQSTYVRTLISTNASVHGRTNVRVYVDDRRGRFDTLFVHEDGKGNLSQFQGSQQFYLPPNPYLPEAMILSSRAAWVTLPLGGGDGTAVTIMDTTLMLEVLPGFPVQTRGQLILTPAFETKSQTFFQGNQEATTVGTIASKLNISAGGIPVPMAIPGMTSTTRFEISDEFKLPFNTTYSDDAGNMTFDVMTGAEVQ